MITMDTAVHMLITAHDNAVVTFKNVILQIVIHSHSWMTMDI